MFKVTQLAPRSWETVWGLEVEIKTGKWVAGTQRREWNFFFTTREVGSVIHHHHLAPILPGDAPSKLLQGYYLPLGKWAQHRNRKTSYLAHMPLKGRQSFQLVTAGLQLEHHPVPFCPDLGPCLCKQGSRARCWPLPHGP